MKKEEEDLLIKQAKLGDQNAFTKLYDCYNRLIKYVINNIVKNEDAADDLVSITFTKAFKRIDTYINPISFEMWLKTIAINSTIDYIRANKQEQQNHYIDSDDNYIQLESSTLDPESLIIKTETADQLKIALSKLRSKYRNILQLRYFKGLSYEELASELGMPIGTIKSDLNKAKKRLKDFFFS